MKVKVKCTLAQVGEAMAISGKMACAIAALMFCGGAFGYEKVDFASRLLTAESAAIVDGGYVVAENESASSVVMPESVFALGAADVCSNIVNVVERGDAESAMRLAAHYSNYLSQDSVGNVWLYIAAQLGNKTAEYRLFTGDLRGKGKDIFSAEALRCCEKANMPRSVAEYVRLQKARFLGEAIDWSQHSAIIKQLPTTNEVAAIKEFCVAMRDGGGSSGGIGCPVVGFTYRMPRCSRARKITGYILSFAVPGGMPGEWLDVIEKYGDVADKEGLLLINANWNMEIDAKAFEYCISSAITKLEKSECVRLGALTGKVLPNGVKNRQFLSQLRRLLDIETIKE